MPHRRRQPTRSRGRTANRNSSQISIGRGMPFGQHPIVSMRGSFWFSQQLTTASQLILDLSDLQAGGFNDRVSNYSVMYEKFRFKKIDITFMGRTASTSGIGFISGEPFMSYVGLTLTQLSELSDFSITYAAATVPSMLVLSKPSLSNQNGVKWFPTKSSSDSNLNTQGLIIGASATGNPFVDLRIDYSIEFCQPVYTSDEELIKILQNRITKKNALSVEVKQQDTIFVSTQEHFPPLPTKNGVKGLSVDDEDSKSVVPESSSVWSLVRGPTPVIRSKRE